MDVDKEKVLEQMDFILEKRPDNLTQWEKDLINDRFEAFKHYGSSLNITEAQAKSIGIIHKKVKLYQRKKL